MPLIPDLSRKQIKTIDVLLSTYRELVPCDLVNYEVYRMAKGGIYLTIEKRLKYYILSTGEVRLFYTANEGRFHLAPYFES